MSRFGLDDVQAQAILDMQLKRLQGLDREKLQTEYKELEEKIAYFLRVLSDEGLVKSILKEELTAIADKFGDDRKTEIQDVEDELDIEDLIEEEQCVFTLTENGYIKRTPVSANTPPRARAAWARRASPPGRRTPWWTCSPRLPTTISCSLPTPARSTARRAIRSLRAARPPRA